MQTKLLKRLIRLKKEIKMIFKRNKQKRAQKGKQLK